ncbi:MAG: DUF3108 domain-containing protein [Candidatus Marinimicrobia bacterium]|nr:DUF3108 domain-containing protein [Candidatus Neomarinimicrobiota bacterium]
MEARNCQAKNRIIIGQIIMILVLIFITPPIQATIVDTPLSKLTQAEKFFLLGKYKQSIDVYKNYIYSSQNKEVLTYNIGYISYLQDNIDSAEHYCDQALHHNPDYGPALLLKGLIAQKFSKPKSKDYFEESIKHHPEVELPLFYLGKYYYENGEFDQAYKYLNRAINTNDKFSSPYSLLGKALSKMGNNQKAIDKLENGLEVSYDAKILATLIELYQETSQIQKAKKYSGLFKFLFPAHPLVDQLIKKYPESNFKMGFEKLPERDISSNDFLPVGEKRMYNVSLGPLKVGELYTAIQDSLVFNDKEVYQVRFSLDSNPDLAFAAVLHSDYISYIDKYTKQVELHYLHTYEDDKIWDKIYEFDRDKHKFLCRTVHENGHIDIIEKYLPQNAIDGTSILFYARQVVREKRSERVMTIIDENFVISDINFPDKKEVVKVREKEEECIMISGTNHYKGIVGFTGDFRGWFRDNETLLPVTSDFKIWVGRIKVTMASEEEQKLHKYAR